MRDEPRRGAAATALLAVLLATSAGAPARAVPRIAVHTYRYGPWPQICTMRADGSDVRRLTSTSTYEQCPCVSPDDAKIVFESTRDGTNRLYVMDMDGGNVHRATTLSNVQAHAAWSPDGTRIACSTVVGVAGKYDIYVMNADGTSPKRLTTTTTAQDMAPAWSPDGTRLAFTSDRDGFFQIYVMNTDGTEQRRLLHTPGEAWGAKWSPDGSRIAYTAVDTATHQAVVHVMNADTTGDVALTDPAAYSWGPDWSPDGSRIVAATLAYGANAELVTMAADGSDLRRVTTDQGDYGPPDWGPADPTDAVGAAPGLDVRLTCTNPFRARGTVRFTVPRPGAVTLAVLDSSGRHVRDLLDGWLGAGTHAASWDGRDDAGRACAPGVYHCRLTLGGTSRAAKLVLVR